MMKRKAGILFSLGVIITLFAFVSGCKTTQTQTKAKTGGSQKQSYERKYPDSIYLTAIGTGQSEPEARNRALSELSRIFEAKVKSDTMDRVRSVVKTAGGRTTEDTEQRIESQLDVISHVELKGVEIAETWKEKATHYALAALERAKARDTWLREIEDLDRKIASKLSAAEEIRSQLMRYRALKETSTLWLEREVLVSRLSVIGHREAGPKSYDPARIFREIPRIKANMPIYLNISGGYGREAREVISQRLGRSGFVITDRKEGAPVVISGSVEVKRVDIPHPDWKYARGLVALKVRDAQAGLTVGEVKTDKRSSHLTYDEAAQKAARKVLPDAAEELVRFLEEPPLAE